MLIHSTLWGKLEHKKNIKAFNNLFWSKMKILNLKIVSCNVLWRELCYYASLSPNRFEFKYLPFGLHNDPKQLRVEVQRAIDDTPDTVDAILLGYGLCSKGTEGLCARKTRLVITRGHIALPVSWAQERGTRNTLMRIPAPIGTRRAGSRTIFRPARIDMKKFSKSIKRSMAKRMPNT